jgi:outer membrane lipoprotein-sorting protein
MTQFSRQRFRAGWLASLFFLFAGTGVAAGQQADAASVIRKVDAAVKARIDHIAGYTVTEHYTVYRGKDEVHPVAAMVVHTTYKPESGKSYVIVSQTGSALMRDLVLKTILENEKHLNQPGVREGAWITSANYEMKLKPGGPQELNGRPCLVLELTPRRKAPYLIQGSLWVDARDGSIVQLAGTATKNSSLVSGPTQMVRQYGDIDGYPEATHLRAESSSMLGETVVKVEYQDYRVELRPGGSG